MAGIRVLCGMALDRRAIFGAAAAMVQARQTKGGISDIITEAPGNIGFSTGPGGS